MSDWWLVARRDDANHCFICFMVNGLCYPPPQFGEPIDAKHLILITNLNLPLIAQGGYGGI